MTSEFALKQATADQLRELYALRKQAADDLSARFGSGHWGRVGSFRTMQEHQKQGLIYAGLRGQELVAMLRYSTQRPRFYRMEWFTDPDAPAGHLTQMAVRTDLQDSGYGRACVAAIEAIARRGGASYIRLDSYDAPAGAGEFYRKCGYQQVHRGEFNRVPLIYWEKQLET